MKIEAKEMLKNLTLIMRARAATKRVALLCCVLVLMTAGVAMGQQKGLGSGRGSGSGNGAGSGFSRAYSQGNQSSTSEATTVFRSARDLITDGDWAKAQQKFNEYVTSFPNEKNLDAALYWMAYADYKLAKYDQCRSTIDRLLQKYPETNWKDDARTLLAQVPGASVYSYQDMVRVVRGQAVAVTPPPQEPQVEDTPSVTVPAFTLAGPAIPV